MPNQITVTGNGPMDEGKRKEALEWLNNNAKTEELTKMVMLAKNPGKRKMLAIL